MANKGELSLQDDFEHLQLAEMPTFSSIDGFPWSQKYATDEHYYVYDDLHDSNDDMIELKHDDGTEFDQQAAQICSSEDFEEIEEVEHTDASTTMLDDRSNIEDKLSLNKSDMCHFDYGFPDPDWPAAFNMIHAFSNGFAIYDKYANKRQRRWSDKYRYYCNGAIAQDLFSQDDILIKRAVHWLQRGFKLSSSDLMVRRMLGEIDTWRLARRVSQELNWTVPRTMRYLAKNLSRCECKDLREASIAKKSQELDKLVFYISGPMYMRTCGRNSSTSRKKQEKGC